MPKTNLPVVRPMLDRVRRLEQDRLRVEALKAKIRLQKLQSRINIRSDVLLKPSHLVDEVPYVETVQEMLWADAVKAVDDMDLTRPVITPFSPVKERIRVLFDCKDQDPKAWPEIVKKTAVALRPEGLPLDKRHRLRTVVDRKRVYFSLPSLMDILGISVM